MIESKRDYLYYLEADRIALKKDYDKPNLFYDETWKFQRLLRKVEYIKNCKKGFFFKLYMEYLNLMLYRKQLKLHIHVFPNCFGPGLSISHAGTMGVNGDAVIGDNCRIHNCVIIGSDVRDSNKVPKIGNNVYIGPGAKIYGDVVLADNIAVGANSVVEKSFLETGITIAGVPARKVSDRGSRGFIIEATKILKERGENRGC